MAPHSHRSFTVPEVVGVLLALLLIFGLAYQLGVRGETKSAELRIYNVASGERRLRRDVEDCNNDLDRISESNKELRTKEIEKLRADKHVLEKSAGELFQQQFETSTAAADCLESAKEQKEDWTADDQKTGSAIRALMMEISELRVQARTLQAGGMRFRLLKQALKNTRRRNYALRMELGRAMPEPEHEVELINKYGLNSTSVNLTSMADSMTKRETKRLQKLLDSWRIFVYNSSLHKDIFVPVNSSEQPTWFNHTGNPTLTVGTLDRRRAPISTTSYSLRAVMKFSLCALKTNNSLFTYPTHYFRYNNNTTSLQSLHGIINTPLITFCEKCPYLFDSPEFRLACRVFTEQSYGSYDWWTARSMVRWAPSVYTAAETQWKDIGLVGKKVLGVAFKSTPLLVKRCMWISNRVPRWHYVYLRGNFKNRTLFEASDSPLQQCQPSLEGMREAVMKLHKMHKYDALFITMESEELIDEVRGADFGGLSINVLTPTSGYEDAVDVTMLSMSSQLLLNRFSDHSKAVAEDFMLRNSMKPDGIHFF